MDGMTNSSFAMVYSNYICCTIAWIIDWLWLFVLNVVAISHLVIWSVQHKQLSSHGRNLPMAKQTIQMYKHVLPRNSIHRSRNGIVTLNSILENGYQGDKQSISPGQNTSNPSPVCLFLDNLLRWFRINASASPDPEAIMLQVLLLLEGALLQASTIMPFMLTITSAINCDINLMNIIVLAISLLHSLLSFTSLLLVLIV